MQKENGGSGKIRSKDERKWVDHKKPKKTVMRKVMKYNSTEWCLTATQFCVTQFLHNVGDVNFNVDIDADINVKVEGR